MSRGAPRIGRPLAGLLTVPLVALLAVSVLPLTARVQPASAVHLLAGEYILDDVEWPPWPHAEMPEQRALDDVGWIGSARIVLHNDGRYVARGGVARVRQLVAWSLAVGTLPDGREPSSGLITIDDIEFVTADRAPSDGSPPEFTARRRGDALVVDLGSTPYSDIALQKDGRLCETPRVPGDFHLIWRRLRK